MKWDEKLLKCVCNDHYQADSTGKCQHCPKPGVWDNKQSKCMKCPEGFTYNQTLSVCACPADKPYLTSEPKCVECKTVWNETAKTCLECKDNKTWDATAQKCACLGEFKTDAEGKCAACPPPNHWSDKKKICLRCPDGFTYDQAE